MTEHLTRYETTFILRPDMQELDATKLVTKIENNIASRGGNIITASFWGKQRLAYRILKQDFGYYATIVFHHPAGTIGEFEQELRLMPEVMRHLILSLDKENVPADQMKLVDPFKDRDYASRANTQAELTVAPRAAAAPKSTQDEESRLAELDEKLGDILGEEEV